MADKRIIELEERLTLSDGDYLATDNTNGTCKVNAKILLDRFSDDEDAIATKAAKVDLTNISITGSTNNTGSTIASGTYFYKDGTLVKAIAAIANGATLTLNTNYEIVTAGGLNDLNDALIRVADFSKVLASSAETVTTDAKTYTATQKCWAYYRAVKGNESAADATVYLNGNEISHQYLSYTYCTLSVFVPLDIGDTIKFDITNLHKMYKIYGCK